MANNIDEDGGSMAFLGLRKWLVLGVVILAGCNQLVGTGVGDGDSGSGSVPPVSVEGRFVKGEPAPGVVMSDFDGNEVDLSEFYGQKAVLIDFWAGWCPFCVAEMPELEKIRQEKGDQIEIFGVHRSETEGYETGLKFAQDRGVQYTLLRDDGTAYRATGGIGMPVAVFIDGEGVVQEVKSGPKTAEEIAAKTEALVL